jgi:DNA-binding MarR family transcriptional regulator
VRAHPYCSRQPVALQSILILVAKKGPRLGRAGMEATPCGKDLTGLFARVSDALLSPLHDQLKSSGLSIGDWRLLKSLHRDERGIGDIAEHGTLLCRPPITRAIGRLARAGLVRRCVASADRCFSGVRLTKRGQGVLRRLAVLEARLERMAEEALGKTASAKLRTALAQFIRSIEKREKRVLPKRLQQVR